MSRGLSASRSPVARWSCLMTIGAMLLVLPAAPAAAASQSTTDGQAAELYPRSLRYDLASMTLPPGDFPVEDLAVVGGRLLGAEQEAAALADSIGMDVDSVVEQLEDIGWRGRYIADVGSPSESDPSQIGIGGGSYVSEYDDEEAAEAGFALLERETAPDSEDIDAPEVGDESELTRSEGEAEDSGVPYVQLDYTFRSGDLVAGVSLVWFEGTSSGPVDPEEMADTAQLMLDRIEEVRDAETSGPFMNVLRLESTDEAVSVGQQEYVLQSNGEPYAFFGETEEFAEPINDLWAESGVLSVYRADAYFLPSGASSDEISSTVIIRVFELERSSQAEEFVDVSYQDFLANLEDTGYRSVEPLDELPEFDGAAAGVSYTFEIEEGIETSGYRLWFNVDSYVVSIEADSPEGIELEVVHELALKQSDCIQSEGFCRPIDVPDGIVD